MKTKPAFPVSQNGFEQWVYDNAFNIPILLDSDPTTSENQLPRHGDSGYRGNNLFIRLGDTIVKFSGTST